MRVEKADSSMLPLILTFQYRQEWPHGEMDSVKGGFPRGNETLGTSTQGSGELLLTVPRFTPQKKWQLKSPAPRGPESVLRVGELSF